MSDDEGMTNAQRTVPSAASICSLLGESLAIELARNYLHASYRKRYDLLRMTNDEVPKEGQLPK